MKIKQFIVGGLTGSFIYFLLGWLVYSVFLNDFIEAHPGLTGEGIRGESSLLPIILGKLLTGFLFTYLLISSKTQTMMGGLKKGAIFGFLISSSTSLIAYGNTSIYSKTFIAADVITFTLISAIAGFAIIIIADLDDKTLVRSSSKSKRSR